MPEDVGVASEGDTVSRLERVHVGEKDTVKDSLQDRGSVFVEVGVLTSVRENVGSMLRDTGTV